MSTGRIGNRADVLHANEPLSAVRLVERSDRQRIHDLIHRYGQRLAAVTTQCQRVAYLRLLRS
jgi:hypothetical protein